MSITISLIGDTPLTQWDVNRSIKVTGAGGDWKAHYYTDCTDRALVVPPEEDGTVPIPNLLLQSTCPITVAIYHKEAGATSEGTTVTMQTFRVTARTKPQDYDYTENIGYIDWVEKSKEVQDLMDELHRRAESGEFDGADGYSPMVEILPIPGGHQVSITDVGGTHVFEVLGGKDGAPGAPGPPGRDGVLTPEQEARLEKAVLNTDIASDETLGIVKTDARFGTQMRDGGIIATAPATQLETKAGKYGEYPQRYFKPLNAQNIGAIAYYGLLDACGIDTSKAGAIGEPTVAQQAAIQRMIGIYPSEGVGF